MTVSRVLNKSANVKPATVEKVEEALQKLGYRRNPMVDALMSQVRRRRVHLHSNLAWLEEEETDGKQRKRIKLLRERAEQRAAALGYGFETIFHKPNALSAERIDSMLKARGVHGVIIAPIQSSGSQFDFPWDHYSVATLGRSLQTPTISHVMMHFQHAMERTVEELRQRGYQRIGFWTTREAEMRSEHLPLMTYLRHNYRLKGSIPIEPLWLDSLSVAEVRSWYQSNRPEAIISSPFSGWEIARQLAVKIPEEVGFVTLSSPESAPRISGMRVPLEAMAHGVVDSVVAQIHRNEQGVPKVPKCMMVEASWHEGRTLRPQNRP